MRAAVTASVFLVLVSGCGSAGLSGDERRRADGALAAIQDFCRVTGRTVFAHGGLSPAEDRKLHAERRGVELLIDIYRDKPDAEWDPPGAVAPAPMRAHLDRLSRQIRFCDIEATDAIVRALRD